MAIAIKALTAKHAYKDITTDLTDKGRKGKLLNCPTCGEEYVLYYGQQTTEQEATAWLNKTLPTVCHALKGWLTLNENAPVSSEEHRQRIERAIKRLQRQVDAESAAAQEASGNERERLILAYSEKEGRIKELRQEL